MSITYLGAQELKIQDWWFEMFTQKNLGKGSMELWKIPKEFLTFGFLPFIKKYIFFNFLRGSLYTLQFLLRNDYKHETKKKANLNFFFFFSLNRLPKLAEQITIFVIVSWLKKRKNVMTIIVSRSRFFVHVNCQKRVTRSEQQLKNNYNFWKCFFLLKNFSCRKNVIEI